MSFRKPQGFATLSPERLREIASMGGKSVDPARRIFSRNTDVASKAGQKGGRAVPKERRSFFVNRELAVAAGRKGAATRKAMREARS